MLISIWSVNLIIAEVAFENQQKGVVFMPYFSEVGVHWLELGHYIWNPFI